MTHLVQSISLVTDQRDPQLRRLSRGFSCRANPHSDLHAREPSISIDRKVTLLRSPSSIQSACRMKSALNPDCSNFGQSVKLHRIASPAHRLNIQ